VNGREAGRVSLSADAAYCGLAALCLVVFARPLAEALGIPLIVVVLAAVGTAAWGVFLRFTARRETLRPWLVRVLVANVLAAGLIGALAVIRPRDGFSLLLVAVAVEVAAFAVSQAIALRRLV
jgi:hypothetical protein